MSFEYRIDEQGNETDEIVIICDECGDEIEEFENSTRCGKDLCDYCYDHHDPYECPECREEMYYEMVDAKYDEQW